MKFKKKEKPTVGELMLQPEFCEPQTDFDSLMRYFLHRIIEKEESITLDLTDFVKPAKGKPGIIRWQYGAWTGDEKLRNSGEPVPFDKIDRLEVTLWFEPEEIMLTRRHENGNQRI